MTQASTVRLGMDENGQDVFVPMSQLLPMVNPDDLGMIIHQLLNLLSDKITLSKAL